MNTARLQFSKILLQSWKSGADMPIDGTSSHLGTGI